MLYAYDILSCFIHGDLNYFLSIYVKIVCFIKQYRYLCSQIEGMNENNDTPLHWFAMSAPYRNELKAQADIEAAGLRCFIPMRWELRTNGNTKKRVRVPVLHNLLFVRGTEEQLKEFKTVRNYIQYLMRPTLDGRREKIIVPDRQMDQFIRVCESDDDSLRYLEPEEVNLRKGAKVRIIGGAFDGAEGQFIRVKGARNRRFVVTITGLAAVSVEVAPDLIEVLDRTSSE